MDFLDVEPQIETGPVAFTVRKRRRPVRMRIASPSDRGWRSSAPIYTREQVKAGFLLRVTCPECAHFKVMSFRFANDPKPQTEFLLLETSLENFKCTACGKRVFAIATPEVS